MVEQLRRYWRILKKNSFFRYIFSRILGFYIPYSGTTKFVVIKVEPGYARLCLPDHRTVRNHLNSIHALAISNVGELSAGLALHFALDKKKRAILTELSTQYFKKARGKIIAEAKLDTTDIYGSVDVISQLFDQEGILIARVKTTWLVGKATAK